MIIVIIDCSMVNSIDRDETMAGYDLTLLRASSRSVRMPVIACICAATVDHLRDALEIGRAYAAAAGSMFVFHGNRQAVFIRLP